MPHSLQTSTTTMLVDVGVDIKKVWELLEHHHIMTMQFYDQRRRYMSEVATHDMSI
jgi:site-specific recombinase XerD